MAHYRVNRRHSTADSDSGVSVNTIATTVSVNPKYACYWLNKCQGQHELNECSFRKSDLRGKLGIYYSPNGLFKRFTHDRINIKQISLESNPTGCTMISLLIYKIEAEQPWLLLVRTLIQRRKSAESDENTNVLELPYCHPYIKGERQEMIAKRAMQKITNRRELIDPLRSKLRRFLFVDAHATYPVYLTNEDAQLLSSSSVPEDSEVRSLHWFPLSAIQSQIPTSSDFLKRQAANNELAQTRHGFYPKVELNDSDGMKYSLWSHISSTLWCIHNFVGFNEFLKV